MHQHYKPNSVQLSVGVVTRNRPESLAATLRCVREQSVQPHEIVVSDDSDQEFQESTRQIAESFDCRYVFGPQRGLYANRNAVALVCSGTHLRTMDDDHLFPKDHFERCLQAVESGPEDIWTTGETTYVDGMPSLQFERASQLDPSGMGIAASNPDNNWAIADGSTIYPLKIFRDGHRMVEWFRFGISYLEFGAYLYRCGFRSRCIEGVKVEHHMGGTKPYSRLDDPGWLESRIYAMLCYNLYFQPNLLLALKYSTACLREGGMKPELLASFKVQLQRVHERWGNLRKR